MKNKLLPLSIIALTLIALIVTLKLERITSDLYPVIVTSSLVILAITAVLGWFLKKEKDKHSEYAQNVIATIGSGLLIISWFLNSYFTDRSEIKRNELALNQSTIQAQKQLKVKFLLDAYFRLENAGFRDTFPPGRRHYKFDLIYLKHQESAISLIQLLSGDSTVKLAAKYALSNGNDYYQDLLLMLRNELRNELKLCSLPDSLEYTPTHFRVFRNEKAPYYLTDGQEFELTMKLNELNRELIK